MRLRSLLLVGASGIGACADEVPQLTPPNADMVPPTIASVSPADGSVDVRPDTEVSVTFSEPINRATVAVASFFLTRDGTAVAGGYEHDGTMAAFVPDSALDSLTLYTATVTAAVRDPAGNPVAAPMTWSFTTGTPATPVAHR